ncbi:MAG: class A beta-lactamase-related serine hydrolase [Acidobacteria bacterium]|nr:MAG: class A beta-lactamase-related serine hydrolase [Acidobacteriota bacterium]REK06292.1 MAG: class A beta-lactamase-related serine hydrolase [Acidobacteriota bacterium]
MNETSSGLRASSEALQPIGSRGLASVLASMALLPLPVLHASQPGDDLASRARTYLEKRADAPAFSAAILIASRGEVVVREAYGMADFELAVPLRPDHVFRIGSLTKPFTAAAALRLRDEDRLELSTSVCDFVLRCPSAWRQVTIAHLLGHTSGIPDLFGHLDAVPAPATRAEVDRVLEEVGELALESSPGASYAYSNFNYVLLGYVIEVIAGKSWESFLLSDVLLPDVMPDTRYDDVWAVVPRRVHGYELENGELRLTRYTDHAAYAAGGLRSTLDDLRRWSDAYWAGGIVPKATVAQAVTPGLGSYGYGWQTTQHFGKTVHNHTGGMRGFASHLAFYPGEELLIIVLSNVEDENTKGTACDLAALAFAPEAVPSPGIVMEQWLERANEERCAVRQE